MIANCLINLLKPIQSESEFHNRLGILNYKKKRTFGIVASTKVIFLLIQRQMNAKHSRNTQTDT